jgi:4-hydroxybenzoate polyprenyltransferase
LIGFSVLASAGYLLNDLLNLKEDQHHPRKRRRPLASGRLSSRVAWQTVAVLLVLAMTLLIGFYGWGKVVWIAGGYFILQILYSTFLRSLPLIDVLVLAVGFVARVGAGSYALQVYDFTVHPTVWLLSCTYFVALLLGFGKRKGEWLLMQKTKSQMGVTRKALQGYTSELLDVLTCCSAILAGGTYIAYCWERPDRIPFVMTGIPVLAGIMSYLRLAWRSTLVETPERLFLHSPALVVSVVAWLAMVAFFTGL